MVAKMQPHEKIAIFTLIEAWKVFLALKVPQNCYIMSISSPTQHIYKPCPKNNPHNLRKYESKGTSKIPISQLFSELGKS